jgi:hypothetical protein
MSKITIRVEATARADPETAFALLKDGATWPAWSLFTGYELERPGSPDPLGVGCVRVFITPVSRVREEVVELAAGRRLAYVLLSGLPLREYRAHVDLTPRSDGSCQIAWTSSFRPDPAWMGWFWRWFMRRTMRQVAGQLASAAERASAAAPRSTGPIR